MPDLSLDLLGFHYQPLFMVCCCAGSVMYLFRGEFGSMLYTGDFRWETNSDKTQSGKNQILSILEGDKLDIVYLDNTYCNPLFSFPPRDVVAQQVHFFRILICAFLFFFFLFFIWCCDTYDYSIGIGWKLQCISFYHATLQKKVSLPGFQMATMQWFRLRRILCFGWNHVKP